MLIRDFPEGGVITEPGAYRDVPMELYHSQDICGGPSISSSSLRDIFLKSPFDYWSYSNLNPKAFPREDSPAMAFGRAAHTLILGDEVFEDHYEIRPEEFQSYKSGAAQAWKRDVIAMGRTPVTPEDVIHIGHMAERLYRMEMLDVLMEGHQEVSHFWRDPVTDVWVKSRIDQTSNGSDLVDLKVTFDATFNSAERAFRKRGYNQQGALGYEASEMSWGITPPGFFLIFIEPAPPYRCSPIPIEEDQVTLGRFRNRQALNTFAECLKSGHWPYPEEAMNKSIGLAPWEQEELDAAKQAAIEKEEGST